MPRPAKIWKRSQGGSYYATIRGEQVRLSEDYSESQKLFHTLKKEAEKKSHKRLNSTLEEVCNKFLDHAQLTKAAATYENQKHYLQALCDKFGKAKRVRDLTGSKIERWLLEKGWGQSTRAAAGATATNIKPQSEQVIPWQEHWQTLLKATATASVLNVLASTAPLMRLSRAVLPNGTLQQSRPSEMEADLRLS